MEYTDNEINEVINDVIFMIERKGYQIVDAQILSDVYIRLCKGQIIQLDDVEIECKKAVKQLKSMMPRLKDNEDLFKAMTEICDEHFDKLYNKFDSIDKLYLYLLELCVEKYPELKNIQSK